MNPTRPAHPTFVWLDVARALAALIVLGGHLRAYVFNDSVASTHLTAGWKAFYFVTSLQHQAVIVFFVLSGFLITRTISKQSAAGRWSWSDYAVKRLSRLWIVLLPALVLTFVWDQLGMRLPGAALYSGDFNAINHSTPFGPLSFTLPTFLGNVVFLQSVLVPPFGTDTPLWSLANEFWYYLLFPLFFFAYRPLYGLASRIGLLTIGTALSAFLLPGQCPLGVVWLMGYAAYLLYRRFKFQSQLIRTSGAIVGAIVFGAVLVASKTFKLPDLPQDYITGTAFTLFLVPLASIGASDWIAKPAKVLAGFSYTLYVTHFPFLAFVTSVVTHNLRVAPGLHGSITFASLFVLVLAYAYVVSLAFERNTAAIQRTIVRSIRTIGLPGRTSEIALRPE